MKNILGKIGIIGGTGLIGGAILKNILEKKFIEPENVWVSNLSGKRNEFLNKWNQVLVVKVEELVTQCDTIILSVRPQHFKNLKITCENQLIISVMAGVKVQKIMQMISAHRIIRCMPNAALEIGESYTPWFATPNLKQEVLECIQKLFQTLGTADQVQCEDDMEFFTALTGSGQGWIAFLESCLIKCAENHGLSAEVAKRAVQQLFFGISHLLAETQIPVEQIVKDLVDYAGTTAAGLKVMINSDIKNELETSILAAYNKANSDLT